LSTIRRLQTILIHPKPPTVGRNPAKRGGQPNPFRDCQHPRAKNTNNTKSKPRIGESLFPKKNHEVGLISKEPIFHPGINQRKVNQLDGSEHWVDPALTELRWALQKWVIRPGAWFPKQCPRGRQKYCLFNIGYNWPPPYPMNISSDSPGNPSAPPKTRSGLIIGTSEIDQDTGTMPGRTNSVVSWPRLGRKTRRSAEKAGRHAGR